MRQAAFLIAYSARSQTIGRERATAPAPKHPTQTPMLLTSSHALALWLTTLACLTGWLVDVTLLPGAPPGELPWLWALHLIGGAVAAAHAPLRRTLPVIVAAALLTALLAPALRPLWLPQQDLATEYLQWRALATIPAALLLTAALRARDPHSALGIAMMAWLGTAAHTLICLHRSSTPAQIGISALITAALAALPLMRSWQPRRANSSPRPTSLARRATVGAICALCLLVPALTAASLDQDAPEALLATSPFYRDPAFLLAHQMQRALRELTAGTTSLLLADWPTQLAPLRPHRFTHAVAITQAALAPLLALALSWARAVEAHAPPDLTAARRAIWASTGALALVSLLALWLLPELPMRPHTALALRWALAALPWIGAALCAAHLLLAHDAPWGTLAPLLICWGGAMPAIMSTLLPAPRVALVIVAAGGALTTWVALRHTARMQTT